MMVLQCRIQSNLDPATPSASSQIVVEFRCDVKRLSNTLPYGQMAPINNFAYPESVYRSDCTQATLMACRC